MIQRYHFAVIAASLMIILSSCHTHDHPHANDHDGHSHGEDARSPDETNNSISYTLFTDRTELFVDLQPLISGLGAAYAAHLTDLETYDPIERGRLMIELLKDGQKTFEMRDTSPSAPGIFTSEITATSVGPHTLLFIFKGENRIDTFIVNDALVYPDASRVPIAGHDDSGDGISFTKEQAWNTGFLVEPVQRQNIHEVIRTSGKVVALPEKVSVVTATSNGLITFHKEGLQVGSSVEKGQKLFSINSQSLLSSNTGEKYRKAEAQLEMTRSNYERAESLLKEDIIGRKEYEKRKMEYEMAKAQWNTLSGHHGQNGSTISAPSKGVITAIECSPNEFVKEGASLIEITQTDKVLLHAEVSQKYVDRIPDVHSANFKTSYSEKVHNIESYNGLLLSFGNTLDEHEHFIPVWFELDRPEDLVIGSYLDIYLLAKEKEDRIVISGSALMQDYQMKYVFVQLSGEEFEKREVTTGVSDGEQVEVLSGLQEGERIVTRGAYQVKMASMSSSIPAHGHSH